MWAVRAGAADGGIAGGACAQRELRRQHRQQLLVRRRLVPDHADGAPRRSSTRTSLRSDNMSVCVLGGAADYMCVAPGLPEVSSDLLKLKEILCCHVRCQLCQF